MADTQQMFFYIKRKGYPEVDIHLDIHFRAVILKMWFSG